MAGTGRHAAVTNTHTLLSARPPPHARQFIVDGVWLLSPLLPVTSDAEGNLNHVL